jgi:iron complex transport system substrate-binding protein
VRLRTVTLAICALAVATAGCGERVEPLGELASPYPVTVTGAGETPVEVERRPTRIVALDPGPAELAARLGSGARLVGVPAGANVPAGARRTVVTTAGGAVSVRTVAELQPDLILATPATDTVDLARARQRSGALVYLQPADSIADVVRGALELGFVLGEPVRARRLADSIRQRVATVEARVEGEPRVRVFIDTGFFVPAPERSLLGDLVRRARGASVTGANPDPLTACQVARRRPDVVLAVMPAGAAAARPRQYACRGKAPRRLVAVPERVVTVAGPRVATSLALVARALHPDAFR